MVDEKQEVHMMYIIFVIFVVQTKIIYVEFEDNKGLHLLSSSILVLYRTYDLCILRSFCFRSITKDITLLSSHYEILHFCEVRT